ncbi:hypothetical protein LDENG_00206230, partial [Lucifuga dentata]
MQNGQYPKWDCRVETARRADDKAENPTNEGRLAHQTANQDQNSQSKKNRQKKLSEKSKVVCVKFPPQSLDETYLRKLMEPFGKIVKLVMFPSFAYVELGSSDQAKDLVKFYNNNPPTVNGHEINFSISSILNFLQSSQVLTFIPAPVGEEGRSDLLSIIKRFGPVLYTLFLPSMAFVEMKKAEDAQKLVNYYSSTALRLNNDVIKVAFSGEYKTLMQVPSAKRYEEKSSTMKTRSPGKEEEDRTVSSKKRRSSSNDRKEKGKNEREEERRKGEESKKGEKDMESRREREENKKDERKKDKEEDTTKGEKKDKEIKIKREENKKGEKKEEESKKDRDDTKKGDKKATEIKREGEEKESKKAEEKKERNEKEEKERRHGEEEKKRKNEEERGSSERRNRLRSRDEEKPSTSSVEKMVVPVKTERTEITIGNEETAPPAVPKPEADFKAESESESSGEDSDIEGMEVIGEDEENLDDDDITDEDLEMEEDKVEDKQEEEASEEEDDKAETTDSHEQETEKEVKNDNQEKKPMEESVEVTKIKEGEIIEKNKEQQEKPIKEEEEEVQKPVKRKKEDEEEKEQPMTKKKKEEEEEEEEERKMQEKETESETQPGEDEECVHSEKEVDFPIDLENCITLDELNEDETEVPPDDKDKYERRSRSPCKRVIYINSLPPRGVYSDTEFVKMVKDFGKACRYILLSKRQEGFIEMSNSSEAARAVRELRHKNFFFHGFKPGIFISCKYQRLIMGWKVEPDNDSDEERKKERRRRERSSSQEKELTVQKDPEKELVPKKTPERKPVSKTTQKKDSAPKQTPEKEPVSKTSQERGTAAQKAIEKECVAKMTRVKQTGAKKGKENEAKAGERTNEMELLHKNSSEKDSTPEKTENKNECMAAGTPGNKAGEKPPEKEKSETHQKESAAEDTAEKEKSEDKTALEKQSTKPTLKHKEATDVKSKETSKPGREDSESLQETPEKPDHSRPHAEQ